jgi:L-ascorbate 6-phosphate lactonase
VIPTQSPRSLEEPRPTDAEVSIRYLGQVGFQIKHRGLAVVIDPYLSDSGAEANPIWQRSYAPPVAAEDLRHIELVLCTHDHGDHTDPASLLGILSASPKCRFAGPKQSAAEMERAGIPRDQIFVLNDATKWQLEDLIVEPVAAAHEDYEVDAEGFHRFLGYLLHWEGITLFHAGDTVVTPRLEEALATHSIDIGFLPINGRSDDRRKQDIVGNMDSAEALQLAAGLAGKRGFRLLVPTHYDLYSINGADPAHFSDLWTQTPKPKPAIKLFQPGEEMIYTKVTPST